MPKDKLKSPRATRPRRASLPGVAIVVSRYNSTITERLLQGAVRAYQAAGGKAQHLYIAEAAGSFELLPIAAAAAECGAFAGVLALGCIIRGETRHDRYLALAVTSGLADISLRSGVPVGLGVLTVDSGRQARARAGGKLGNKGQQAMEAMLAAIAEVGILRDSAALELAITSGAGVRRLMHPSLTSPDKLARGRKGQR
ncbi:MAG: 6,7-dimethyl-8-ribityllumazine synthase [Phycisphaerales bacterium]